MTQIYFICQCGESGCGLGWRAIHCIKHDYLSWCLYQAGDLHEIPKDFKQKLRTDGKKVPHSQGISPHIKKIFKSWLKRDDMMTPNKLLIKLTEKRRRNNNKNKVNRIGKYDFDRKLIPTLKQVIEKCIKKKYLKIFIFFIN